MKLRTCLFGIAAAAVAGAETPRYLTYDNTPLGTEKKPLILRTYMPDPGLADEVFRNHGKAANSPRYNVGQGKDVSGEYKPVKGIPAAIGVNHGAALSYCFDTTECRLMYAWQGGFLDMYPYWGDKGRGNRQSFNYVPHLVGNLFFKAAGKHPLLFKGKSLSDYEGAPQFVGYQLVDGLPTFSFTVAGNTFSYRVEPSGDPLSFSLRIMARPSHEIAYRLPDGSIVRPAGNRPSLKVQLKGASLATYQGFPRDMGVKQADAASGKKLYLNYGCIACHSTDGSKSHGPTFAKLFGNKRAVTEGKEVIADEEYLLESIRDPNAKTVDGYPASYMPPYQLKEIEYQALVAFIKSLANPQPE